MAGGRVQHSRRSRGGRGHGAALVAQRPYFGHGDVRASFAMVFPLVLIYECLVLMGAPLNGADVVTAAVFRAAGYSRPGFLLIYAGLAIVFLWWLRRVQRNYALALPVVAPVVLESAIYGLMLPTVLSIIVRDGLGLALNGDTIAAAIGAGVHEELLFRLVGMGVVVWGGARIGLGGPWAVVAALAVSALLFAAAHHWGAHGEPWHAAVFAYRATAGVVFGLLFWFRSLAHAVFAHTIYDMAIFAF